MKKLFSILCIVSFLSCKKEETQDPVYFQRIITKVEGDTTGTVNQVIDITVYWPFSSGCDILDRFEEQRTGSTLTIKAIGHFYNGVCTQDAGIKTRIYKFSSSVKGNFELRFYNPDNTFITHRVIIN